MADTVFSAGGGTKTRPGTAMDIKCRIAHDAKCNLADPAGGVVLKQRKYIRNWVKADFYVPRINLKE
jgi:hypothetical protein